MSVTEYAGTSPELEISESVDAIEAPGLEEAVERHLQEAAAAGSAIRADGLVPLYVIRPGIGKGRGKHLYEADMLERETRDGRFTGWKMYLDHQSPEAKKKAAGLPRSIRDLGGIVKEAWWDPNVPADPQAGHGQGAVVGLAKPNRFMRALIEDLPEAIGASISAHATGVRPEIRNGQPVMLVEGIRPRGSVDWVTEAGAGGRVVSLMESLEESESFEQEEEQMLLESLSDEEVAEVLQERPGVRDLIEAGDPEDAADGGSDELAELTKKHLKKFKGNRAMAERAAKRELQSMKEATTEGGQNVDATELLQEALATDEGQTLLAAAVQERFDAIVAPRLAEIVEAALEDERELMQAEAEAHADRRLQVRDLRDKAHELIREARLPEGFANVLYKKFDLVETNGKLVPTDALNVVEDRDGDEVVKTAEEKLREAVAEEIATSKTLLAEANKTTVRGQGSKGPAREKAAKPKSDEDEGEGGDKGGGGDTVEEARSSGSALTDALLEEAHVPQDVDLWKDL